MVNSTTGMISTKSQNADEVTSTTLTKTDDTSSSNPFTLSNWSLDRMSPCSLPPNDEFSPVEHYVTVAITSHTNFPSSESAVTIKAEPSDGTSTGNSSVASYLSGYRAILDCIRKRNDPPLLWKILLALRSRSLSLIASSPSQHAHLLHVIMKLDVYKPPKALTMDINTNPGDARKSLNVISNEEAIKYFEDYSIADAYLHLLVGLVSANSIFLIPCLESIWKNLVQDPTATPAKTSRLHSTLATILRLVPKAQTELFPIIQRNIPFRRADVDLQKWYAMQCLAILQYIPDMLEEILRLLIEKCLEIDVEIKVEKGGGVSLEERDEDEMFDLDMDELEIERKKKDEAKYKEKVEVDEMAERLDTLMTVLMQHIQSYAATSNRASPVVFSMLLRIFNTSILTTHRSKYVQFLILYICGIEDKNFKSIESNNSPQFHVNENRIYRQFAAQLINNLLSASHTNIARQSSVCYLASFIARASYVDPCTICECIAALLRWGDTYTDSYYNSSMDKDLQVGNSKAGVDHQIWKRKLEAHFNFYNVCQAAFYIMCFRGKEAMSFYKKIADSQNDEEQYVDLLSVDIGLERWEKLCSHKQLQPLKFCLESVRREFLHIAKFFNLLPKSFIDATLEEDEKIANAVAEKQARMKRTLNRTPSLKRSIMTPAMQEKQRLRNVELKKKGGKIGGGVGGLGKGSNPLDSFFPFDPCLLRLSHGFIDPFYVDWEGGIRLEEEEDEEEIEDHADADDISTDSDSSSSTSSSSSSDFEMDSKVHHMLDANDFEPMSFTSAGSGMEVEIIEYETGDSFDDNPKRLMTKSHVSFSHQQTQNQLWVNETEKLKRSRAQSIGSGSW